MNGSTFHVVYSTWPAFRVMEGKEGMGSLFFLWFRQSGDEEHMVENSVVGMSVVLDWALRWEMAEG